MDRRELDRYMRLLLAKRDELSVKNTNGESLIPAAGGWESDPVDRATANEEAELQILVCIEPMVVSYERSKLLSFESDKARSGSVKSVTSLFPGRVWKLYLGPITVGIAKSTSRREE